MKILASRCLAVLLLAFGFGANVSAAIAIDFFESNGNLEATLAGSLDINATQSFSDRPNSYDGFVASAGVVAFNRGRVDSYRLDIGSFSPFGNPYSNSWSSSTGDLFAMYGGGFVAVSSDYVSGTNLSASATIIGGSLVGLSTGTFVSTFSSGGVSDTITVRVGQVSPVPIPATAWLFGTALLGLGAMKRKKT